VRLRVKFAQVFGAVAGEVLIYINFVFLLDFIFYFILFYSDFWFTLSVFVLGCVDSRKSIDRQSQSLEQPEPVPRNSRTLKLERTNTRGITCGSSVAESFAKN